MDFSLAIKHDLKNIIYTKINEESYVMIIVRNPQICKFLTCYQTRSEQKSKLDSLQGNKRIRMKMGQASISFQFS